MPKRKNTAPDAATKGGRGSPEAIAKRRAARKLNELLAGGRTPSRATPVDGRTERRRERLRSELSKGTAKAAKSALKPLALLQKVHELLELGETLGALRKVVKIRGAQFAPETAAQALREVHGTYSFHPDAYRFLGLPDDVLVDAGVRAPGPAKRGRRPRAATTG